MQTSYSEKTGSATIAGGTQVDGPRPRQDRLLVYLEVDGQPRSKVVPLIEGVDVTFGRSRGSTVHVDSERVSRTHGRVTVRDGKITVEDLGSRNGTYVNGERITGPTELVAGDEIEMGPATAIVSRATRATRDATIDSTAALEERLEAECDRGRRFRRNLVLLMLRIEGSDGETAADRLAAGLRRMDLLAEYGPDLYAILMPEASEADGEAAAMRLTEVVAAAAPTVRIACGLAAFPVHGTQGGELIAKATAALRRTRPGRPGVARPPEAAPTAAGDIVVADPSMQRVYALIERVAPTSMTVLILGETGTGKEVVAEAIHRESPRRDAPFIRLNCAALPETLLDSELFGHERGAFTGADRKKAGYFQAASSGTLFLDEIGEISAALQAKLLRALQEHRITPVGGTAEVEVDVRVVCATNRDLEAEVQRGTFREDLFFRISGFTLALPPLRDRPKEVPLLAKLFLARIAQELGVPTPSLSSEALAALERYRWPGNVREIRNTMERAVVLQNGGVIELEHLPDRLRGNAGLGSDAIDTAIVGDDMRAQIAGMERAAIVAALEAAGGNQTRAAQQLGISRRALIYKLEKYGLKPRPSERG